MKLLNFPNEPRSFYVNKLQGRSWVVNILESSYKIRKCEPGGQ